MKTADIHTYFLGGSSPTGFRTPFGAVIGNTDYHTFIIKGGPGTGKSSFMKRISAEFDNEEREIYLCSSDPDSLDAVVLKEHKVIFMDGTAPHVYDPEYPGAVQEILNLGDCWDAELLKSNKDEIIKATADYSQYHVRCRRYLTAAASVIGDTKHIGENALNIDKLDGFMLRLAKKILPSKADETGKILFKQISAITPNGYITIPEQKDTIYFLNDCYFAGSDYFLRSFAEIAASKGLDTEVSVCTLHGEEFFEHLRIPQLKISFITINNITDNTINNVINDDKQSINFMRFYSKEILGAKKSRLKFNTAAIDDLIGEAVTSLVSAKEAHDKLEKFYIAAVDFAKVNTICNDYINKIKK